MADGRLLLLVLPWVKVHFGPGAVVRDVEISVQLSAEPDRIEVSERGNDEEGFISNHPGKTIENSGQRPEEAASCAVCWCEPTDGAYTTLVVTATAPSVLLINALLPMLIPSPFDVLG